MQGLVNAWKHDWIKQEFPHTETFNIAFHNFEDILYDHRKVKNANTC